MARPCAAPGAASRGNARTASAQAASVVEPSERHGAAKMPDPPGIPEVCEKSWRTVIPRFSPSSVGKNCASESSSVSVPSEPSEARAAPNVPEASSASAAGVGVRAPSAEEYRSAAAGVGVYVDTPAALNQTSDLRVVSARLSPSDANAFTEAWGRLASAVNEPARDADRVLARVRSTLAIAAEQYETQAGESINDADAFELFASIRNAQADTSACNDTYVICNVFLQSRFTSLQHAIKIICYESRSDQINTVPDQNTATIVMV